VLAADTFALAAHTNIEPYAARRRIMTRTPRKYGKLPREECPDVLGELAMRERDLTRRGHELSRLARRWLRPDRW
jgi:hypothetical protein